jgi:hypothetical protein
MLKSDRYADIIYTDETLREGMQIEDAGIPVEQKIALLDALSETGLKRIMVGSFVSARYTPQMARIEEIVGKGTVGGIGGCSYCGNGIATNMVPTEDLVHMLDGMGYDTGVDLDRLIDCCRLVEQMIGRTTLSHVPKTGPRPMTPDRYYDTHTPFVETMAHAQHFREGPTAYAGAIVPWKDPIQSLYRDRIDRGLPAYELDGAWPWDEPWVPKPGLQPDHPH